MPQNGLSASSWRTIAPSFGIKIVFVSNLSTLAYCTNDVFSSRPRDLTAYGMDIA